jgi:3-polyprenyl-4-hydroxybenzoate decarboxylase
MSNISGIGSSSLSVGLNNSLASVPTSQTSGPFSNLNLTSSQQQQIGQILQNAQSQGLTQAQVQTQINAILTPAQQQQLQKDLQSHHHHHRGGSGASPSSSSSQTDAFGIPTSISSGSSIGTQAIGNIAASYALQNQPQDTDL